jgi:3-oxoacyl-[acyl-carrier-protein] synthase-3
MLFCKPGSRHPIGEELLANRSQYMVIKGREVYKFAVQRFEELILDAMRKCELKAEDIKLIVPHQVNQRIIDSAMHKLGLGMDKAYVNIDRYGNTSSASIPIAFDEALRAGKIVPGDVILTVAFGAGLTWANAVIRM